MDQTLPFVLAVPVLAMTTLWFAIRLLAYPLTVLGCTAALPFLSRSQTTAPG